MKFILTNIKIIRRQLQKHPTADTTFLRKHWHPHMQLCMSCKQILDPCMSWKLSILN